MENIIADKNYKFQPSFKNRLFAIQNVGSLSLLGSSSFTNNFGFVFYVQNAKIVLDGLLNFTNNFAYIGSAFHVIGSSWFVLNESLKANFTGNSAMTIGGAIYASNEQTNECMFTPNGSNISMLFYNNTASYSGNWKHYYHLL